jgi:hypothetical protein
MNNTDSKEWEIKGDWLVSRDEIKRNDGSLYVRRGKLQNQWCGKANFITGNICISELIVVAYAVFTCENAPSIYIKRNSIIEALEDLYQMLVSEKGNSK